MSKAEDKAYECFPNEDIGSKKARFGFLLGYHQAEKDLELTWEDIRDIYDLAYNLRFPHKKQKEFFEEVLKRFKEKNHE